MIEYLTEPFANYGFMRRALIACVAMSFSSAPLGVFLVLRRMALVGDAMSHAILPGVSIAFLIFGVSLWPMTIGGLVAAVLVTVIAVFISRVSSVKEDSSFTGLYLISLAFGVLIISIAGNSVDLLHVLFGNILAVENQALFFITAISSISILGLAIIYRPLIIESFDPVYLSASGGRGAIYHQAFLILVVLNLVSSFQALGTLMALGLMVLPAISAKLWHSDIDRIVPLSILIALISSVAGLLISYHFSLPSGPSVIITAGVIYIFSLVFGKQGSILSRMTKHEHFTE